VNLVDHDLWRNHDRHHSLDVRENNVDRALGTVHAENEKRLLQAAGSYATAPDTGRVHDRVHDGFRSSEVDGHDDDGGSGDALERWEVSPTHFGIVDL
jgi:hypothetical protein